MINRVLHGKVYKELAFYTLTVVIFICAITSIISLYGKNHHTAHAQTPSFRQIDPNTTTDNEINSFLKETASTYGAKKVAAGGAWWGPVDKFSQNQIWTITNSLDIGRVIPVGSTITATFTCLLPGSGTARNQLIGVDDKPGVPRMRFQQSDHADSVYVYGNPLKQIRSFSQVTKYTSGSGEIRLSCTAHEGLTNQFGDGSPVFGDEVRPVLAQTVWYGSKGTIGTGKANHDGFKFKYDSLDVHAWYDHEGYTYAALDGAEMNTGTQVVQLSTRDLIGATVKGKLTVYGFSAKGCTDLTFSLTGEKVCQSNMPIHHMELRIEQNNEDFAVMGALKQPTESSLGSPYNTRGRVGFELDTTKISDGWHVMSWHAHAIDKANPAPYRDKQTAGEVKFLICVNNTNATACNGNGPTPGQSNPQPSATGSGPGLQGANTTTTVSLSVLLHGIGKGGDNTNPAGAGNMNPLHPARTATLTVFDASNTQVLTKQVSLSYNAGNGNFVGSVSDNTLKPGAYTMKIHVSQYLIKTFPGIFSIGGGNNQIATSTTLITGDINNDNKLSILDYNMLLDCFSDLLPAKNCSDTGKKQMTDLNDDGNVNQFDYNLLLREISVQTGI